MNVLLVDDEPLEIEQLKYLIAPKWPMWKLYSAENSTQAINMAKYIRFSLALVDIHLPGKTGLDLIEILKKDNPDLNFIITTAYQDFQYAKKSIQLGVFDYLVKPIIEDELLNVFNRFIKDNGFLVAKSKIVEDTLEIIRKNFNNKLSLESLAETVHVSPSYLSKKFSEELGISIPNFIMNYRIQKAKSILLKYPEYNMAMVAEMVGFRSQNYFSNAFKKHEGISPSDFRKFKVKSYG
jgi:YesN/AraC family two-component response regulator